MPIYEYKCDTCETKFEKLVRAIPEPLGRECPSCGERHLTRQQSTFSARANGVSPEPQSGGGCGGGMCQAPGMCGMN